MCEHIHMQMCMVTYVHLCVEARGQLQALYRTGIHTVFLRVFHKGLCLFCLVSKSQRYFYLCHSSVVLTSTHPDIWLYYVIAAN